MSATLPPSLKFTTLDECAECLPVSRELTSALWALMPANVPPEGEWPEPDSKSRRARSLAKVWPKLSDAQRAEILDAAKREGWIPSERPDEPDTDDGEY